MNFFPDRPTPYIGVSGVVNPIQQARIETMAEEAGVFEAGRRLALGVKAVHKTQYLGIGNKYGPEWYPIGGADFTFALDATVVPGRTMNVAQVALEADYVHDVGYRAKFMNRVMHRGMPWMHAVQFDMLPWHEDKALLGFLENVKNTYDKKILLQCQGPAMNELGPQGVAKRLRSFGNVLDYVLFDASHGTGKRLDSDELSWFLDAAHRHGGLARTGFAVAGGLDAQVVSEDLPRVLGNFPDTSWDAEGKLHPVDASGKRPLDLGVVREFLQASAAVLR